MDMKLYGNMYEVVFFIIFGFLGLIITNNGLAKTTDIIMATKNVLGMALVVVSSYGLGVSATIIYMKEKQKT